MTVTAPQAAAPTRTVTSEEPAESDVALLSVCLIVRDAARTLATCLAGIRPWADELVVVDTGSVDDTSAIAAAYGARVYHFPWCDDFAAARNESLRHARGRWVFWMDADDTIDAANGRALRALAAGPTPDDLLAYVVKVRCPASGGLASGGPDSGGPGADVTVVDHVKLFRNRPDLRFEGRIHEQVLPAVRRAGGEVGWTDLFVTHSGADRSPAGRRRKHERDLRLLRLDLLDRPGHTFVLFNLGMTLADAGDHAAAADALAAAIVAGHPAESHLRKAYALHAASLSELGRPADALDACRRGLAHYPDDPELNFRAGLYSHRVGRLSDAEAHYRRALVPPAGRAFASVDPGVGGYKALYNLAAVYLDQGRPADAAAAYRGVVRLAPGWEPGRAALHGLVRARVESSRAADDHVGGAVGAGPSDEWSFEWHGQGLTPVSTANPRRRHGRESLPMPPQRASWAAGSACGTAADGAIRACERAVDANPRDAVAHADLAVALRRAGRTNEAVAAYELAVRLHRARPAGWSPRHPRQAAELGLLLEQQDDARAGRPTPAPDPTPRPRFTVLLGCYGDFPDYSVRALDSIAAGRDLARHCDVLVGLNACGRATTSRARDLLDAGVVQGLVESRANRNKDPMMRLLVEMVDPPYVLWLDDDSHFVDPGWPGRFADFLAAEHPLDVAGVPARWGPRRAECPAYAAFAAGRPWWRGDAGYPPALREWVPFVPGGLFLARTAFLRRHDFPDRGMTKALDDVALGELVQQVGGRQAYLSADLQAAVRVSDGHRRGENFLLVEGGAY